eukprot:TRINITY_DN6538_c0_g1_i1.p1 TRINITY_DN6538_c0_g1~~TRINITY_DN6538_c0_g1_i1.p1  ORF type:complete len:462 (+),score=40.67 TRINITY_DN6538_c0_g1_i1:60-1445(+)
MFGRLLLSLGLFLVCFSSLQASILQTTTCLYVSQEGSDSDGTGNFSNPFRTIQWALLNSSDSTIAAICLKDGGTYNGIIDFIHPQVEALNLYGNVSDVLILDLQIKNQNKAFGKLKLVSVWNVILIGNSDIYSDEISLNSVRVENSTEAPKGSGLNLQANSILNLTEVTNSVHIDIVAYSIYIENCIFRSQIDIFSYGPTPVVIMSSIFIGISGIVSQSISFTIYSNLSVTDSSFVNNSVYVNVNCYADCSASFKHVNITDNPVLSDADSFFVFTNLYTVYIDTVSATCSLINKNPLPPFGSSTNQDLNLINSGSHSVCPVYCPPGKNSPGAFVKCTDCLPGTYKAGATLNELCSSCPPGRYQPEYGQALCLPCPPFMFSSQPGSVYCSACPYGEQSNQDQTGCAATLPPQPIVPTDAETNSDKTLLLVLWICTGVWLVIFVALVGVYIVLRCKSTGYEAV